MALPLKILLVILALGLIFVIYRLLIWPQTICKLGHTEIFDNKETFVCDIR